MMKGSEFLRYVDQLNHDKNIPRELVFEAVEAAVRLAMEKYYGEEEDSTITVTIDRDNGEMTAKKGEAEGVVAGLQEAVVVRAMCKSSG